jgi:hypothetical protein
VNSGRNESGGQGMAVHGTRRDPTEFDFDEKDGTRVSIRSASRGDDGDARLSQEPISSNPVRRPTTNPSSPESEGNETRSSLDFSSNEQWIKTSCLSYHTIDVRRI